MTRPDRFLSRLVQMNKEERESIMKENKLLSQFNPRKLAYYEKENYVAYYQKRWLRLMIVSVGMVREAFHLSLPQAVYGAYLVARAEIAAAPFPDNDRPQAEAYMRRFYTFLNHVHNLNIHVGRVARVEVEWWVVHRRCFGQAQNQELVEALVNSYSALFGISSEKLREAATHRGPGMLVADQWVNGGRQPGSPLLAQVEDELARAYTALKAALSG